MTARRATGRGRHRAPSNGYLFAAACRAKSRRARAGLVLVLFWLGVSR